jgi:hypothetical protein
MLARQASKKSPREEFLLRQIVPGQDKGPGECRGPRRKDDETVSTGERVNPPVVKLVNGRWMPRRHRVA